MNFQEKFVAAVIKSNNTQLFQRLCTYVHLKNMVSILFFQQQTVDLEMPTWLDRSGI